ncbi:MAG: hypothetical protein DMF56_26695 [Acidobacteria bacterium]|nr:MAG: hypothetical protein DMF56_26695 [Acidobacteriota bacterium]
MIRKPDTAAAALRRCVDTLRKNGLGEALISYRFEDMPNRDSSGSDRISRQFPALQLHVREKAHEQLDNAVQRATIDGAPATVGGETAGMLCEVFEGIARRFPLAHAVVYIHEIPWSVISQFPDAAEAVIPDSAIDGCHGAITVFNHWWTSSRMQGMHASIEVPLGAAGKPEDLPPAIAALLKELGRHKKGELESYLSDAEHAALTSKNEKASELMQRYGTSLEDIAARLAFPNLLPHPTNAQESMTWPPAKIGSYKPALTEVLGAIGYRYESSRSGNGVFKLSKRSPVGYEIELSFDIGSYSRSACGSLSMSGEGWFASVILLVTGWKNNYAGYPIVDATVWRKIIENFRTSIEYYEHTFVPEIDGIYSR